MSPKNLNANKIPKILKKKLFNKKVARLYRLFERDFDIKNSYAVAVSGGPDSLALAYLAKIFSLKNKVKLIRHRIILCCWNISFSFCASHGKFCCIYS